MPNDGTRESTTTAGLGKTHNAFEVEFGSMSCVPTWDIYEGEMIVKCIHDH